MRRLAVSTMALLLVLGGAAQATCRFDPAKIYFGFETPMKGEADSGKPCGFSTSGASTAVAGSFHVTQAPHHGVAGIGDNGGMTVIGYRSVAGYKGPDDFIVSYMGGDIRRPEMPSSIHVYFDVK
jgi:hypothetical protein